MYPRNASSPQRIALGAVVQISDGAVQTSGVSVSVLPQGTTASAGGGTLAFEQGIAHYTPTQAETNYTSFIVIAYKSGCIPASATVVTSASDTAGYAGTDQSKIANATATVNLSGTTIKTATDVETDTADIQSRIPAALVSGRIDASVGAMASGVLTATAIAADAITDAKVASDVTIASVTGAVGSVTGNVGGNVTGSVGSVAAGGISASSFAANAIDAAALAASAVAEIADGVWNAATATYGSAGSYGLLIKTNVDAQISTRSTLDAAGVRSAVGLASANLDTQLDAIPTATENADALLNRDMSAVSDTNARSPLNALRFLRNKWSISGTTLTVTKENDTTTAWTATISTDAAAIPVVGSDPS